MASIIGRNYKLASACLGTRIRVAFKVSRPTIREAMIALEIRGLANPGTARGSM